VASHVPANGQWAVQGAVFTLSLLGIKSNSYLLGRGISTRCTVQFKALGTRWRHVQPPSNPQVVRGRPSSSPLPSHPILLLDSFLLLHFGDTCRLFLLDFDTTLYWHPFFPFPPPFRLVPWVERAGFVSFVLKISLCFSPFF